MRWPEALGTLPRETRDTLFLLAVIAWILAPLTAHLPLWASAFSAGLLLWRGQVAWAQRPLPKRFWLVGLLTLAVAGTWFTHRTLAGRDAGMTLLALLLALKTLEMRARRDAWVVFFLGFFTLLGNFFFSQALPVAAAMLVAVLGLLTALVNAQMPVGRPPLRLALATAGRLAIWGTPVMVLLFVLFPRLGPLWSMPSDGLGGRSGLSGSMQVGTLAELALDDSVALRLRFDEPQAPPPQSALYFRGPVLSRFDGREWLPDPASSAPLPPEQAQRRAQLQVSGPALRYELTLEPHRRSWLLLLDAATEAPQLPGTEAWMAPDLQWQARRPLTEVVRYRAESHPQFRHGPDATTIALRDATDLPGGFNPRTLAWAAQLRSDRRLVPDPNQDASPALLAAVLDHLRTGGYRYTLAPGVYGQHTADEFWFDRKAGFCEHIASAFVVMMRALDIPARIVTGYQGGERNPVDGLWTVRQSDAHAWAEVWLRGQGWVRVDPTSAVAPGRTGAFERLQAPRGLLGNAVVTVVSPDLLKRLRAAWDAANSRWNDWVLNYGPSRQMDLLKGLGFETPSLQDLLRLLAGLLGLGGLLGALWTLRERRRRDPWLRLLQRLAQRCAAAGIAVPASASAPVTPRALAQALRAAYGDAANPVEALLLQLEALRYAPPTAQPLRLASLRRPLEQALTTLLRAPRTSPTPATAEATIPPCTS